MIRFARAEDAFDLTDRLDDVTAPTLVIGGARDAVYSPAIFKETADGVQDGRLILYPDTDHAKVFTNKHLADDVAAFLLDEPSQRAGA
jgi:pimeloyl-ACP methyl ester carboxylesterase